MNHDEEIGRLNANGELIRRDTKQRRNAQTFERGTRTQLTSQRSETTRPIQSDFFNRRRDHGRLQTIRINSVKAYSNLFTARNILI